LRYFGHEVVIWDVFLHIRLNLFILPPEAGLCGVKYGVLDMKCTACSSDIEENAQFCGECGAALSVSPITSSTPQVTVDLPKAVQLGFQRYIDFSGRSSRAEYWWWTLFTFVVSIIAFVVDTVAIGTSLLQSVWSLATFIPSIAIGVRRLHDINRSGWWSLLHLGVGIGSIVLIIWACMPSFEHIKGSVWPYGRIKAGPNK
jgi:uncharacterized membrane protein YhaH (DUF805 family)